MEILPSFTYWRMTLCWKEDETRINPNLVFWLRQHICTLSTFITQACSFKSFCIVFWLLDRIQALWQSWSLALVLITYKELPNHVTSQCVGQCRSWPPVQTTPSDRRFIGTFSSIIFTYSPGIHLFRQGFRQSFTIIGRHFFSRFNFSKHVFQ